MTNIRTILHPTDFSENSHYAFEMACALARVHDAQLILLHVMYPSSAPVVAAPAPSLRRSAESQAPAVGSLPWPQPEDLAIRVEHRVAEGDPVQEIVAASNQLNCDLIVIGTHGRTGLKRLLTGSVAEGTLREASCPVLTVRTGLRSAGDVPAPLRAKPGEVVDTRPLAGSSVQSKSLFLVNEVEVVRQIVPAAFDMPDPGIEKEIIVHCLEGRLNCTLSGQVRTLEGGEMILLPAGSPRTVRAIENASVLLTVTRRTEDKSKITVAALS